MEQLTKREALLNKITEMIENGNRQVITIFNNYFERMKYFDDILLPYDDEFWNITYLTPYEAANVVIGGNIKAGDEYVKFDGNGHPETRNYYTATQEIKELFLSEFIDWTIENDYTINDQEREE